MGLGRRKDERQEELFVPHDRLPRSEGHAFYRQLNKLLAGAGFDRFVEKLCAPYYQPSGTPGRPSIPPGVYFRMLLVGYFEGIGSQRGIARAMSRQSQSAGIPRRAAHRRRGSTIRASRGSATGCRWGFTPQRSGSC